ncbi:MAG: hypothetical protein OET18_05280 [Desulfobacterales bacterium]|nr:hypothetical protein [Desulfobacterales bacterium]
MDSNELRRKFKDSGLSYSKITSKEIALLVSLIKTELRKPSNKNVGVDIESVNAVKTKYEYRKSNGGLLYSFVVGNEINNYEQPLICFNKDDFIYIAEGFNAIKAEPFLKAFDNWVKEIS